MDYLFPGLHRISAEAYHADPCERPSLSSGLAKVLLTESPLHAWTESRRLNPDWAPKESKVFDIGRAAHAALLGAGGEFAAIPDEFLASDGSASTKAAKEFKEECRARGVTPLKQSEVDEISRMVEAARMAMAELGIVLDPARSEMVAIGEIGGVMCRAMIDNAPADPRLPLYDYKTCESANPAACLKAIDNMGYYVQAAHYVDTWKAATGEDRQFHFLFQEKKAPREVCLVGLSEDALNLGREKIARARDMWGLCLRRGQWPGYPRGLHVVGLPAWAHERWYERQSAEREHKRATGADILEAAMRFQHPQGFQGAAE